MRTVFLLMLIAIPARAEEYRVGPVPEVLRKDWKLSDFYKKCLVIDELPILASDKVPDVALQEAAYLIDHLLTNRDDLRKTIVKQKIRVAIMAHDEFTLDVPEHSDLKPAAYWNKRARGLGATSVRPAVSCGTENLLEYKGDPYKGESILIHEFGHVIHQQGLAVVDRDFDRKLNSNFEEAKREGLWKNTYAISNPAEYWAEALQSWFHCNLTNVHEHNHVNSRSELKKYDPRMAKMLEEAFKDNEWVWTPPSRRKDKLHLKQYDSTNAPRFEWPAQMIRDFQENQSKQKKK